MKVQLLVSGNNIQSMSIYELLSRTRFQVLTFRKGTMANMGLPVGAGSGFMLSHKGRIIFVTADHVTHPSDYEEDGENQGSIKDMDIGVVNNWIAKDNHGKELPIITPLGGFYYFDETKFDAQNGFEEFRPFDVTFSLLGEDSFKNPFKNEPFIIPDGKDVPAGLDMVAILSEAAVQPSSCDQYIVWGHTNFHQVPASVGVKIACDFKIHEGMSYVGNNGDYYVLNPNKPINEDEWHGISGAPVFNHEGGLLGILCGGNTSMESIYVMKMSSVLSLIDITIRAEEINQQKQ